MGVTRGKCFGKFFRVRKFWFEIVRCPLFLVKLGLQFKNQLLKMVKKFTFSRDEIQQVELLLISNNVWVLHTQMLAEMFIFNVFHTENLKKEKKARNMGVVESIKDFFKCMRFYSYGACFLNRISLWSAQHPNPGQNIQQLIQ